MESIICTTSFYMPNFGHITTVHLQCIKFEKNGGVDTYKCLCCEETFRGGTNGAFECNDLEAYGENKNYQLCSENVPSFNWFLRQIKNQHHKFAGENFSYNRNMEPILKNCCQKFDLKPNGFNYKKLLDAAVLNIIYDDIQEIINQDKENRKKQLFYIDLNGERIIVDDLQKSIEQAGKFAGYEPKKEYWEHSFHELQKLAKVYPDLLL